jgi:peptidyl-prolyl cis-trans isomerase SurA
MTMKKYLYALMLTAVFQTVHAAPVQEVDRIVAIVNKSVITEQELQSRVAEAVTSLQTQHVTPPSQDILRRQVLDQMITESAQIQFANDNQIVVTDSDVDQAIAHIAQQNKLDLAGLQAELKKQGVDFSTFRTDIKRQVLLARLKDSEVASRVTVTDSEVDQAMKNALYANNTEYHLANILIDVPERADAATIEAKAKLAHKALAEVAAGKSFASVAATYSNSSNAMKGGDLGWRPAASLPPEFITMLDALQPGQFTDVIRTQEGFFIFQLMDKRNQQAQQMAEQYHVEHILVRTNEAMSEADAKTKIEQIRDRIMNGAAFSDMAKLYSEDGSNSRGGDLGWVSQGDTVPEFENAMMSLPLNTVSQPVRSPFGWHLILVLEKRSQDVSTDRARQQVKQQIRARKIEEAYADWVHQLRDAAYVVDRLNDDQ